MHLHLEFLIVNYEANYFDWRDDNKRNANVTKSFIPIALRSWHIQFTFGHWLLLWFRMSENLYYVYLFIKVNVNMTLNYYVLFTRYLKEKALSYKIRWEFIINFEFVLLVIAKADRIFAQAKWLTLEKK